MRPSAIETRRWTRDEYDRLVASGFFHPEERLELVDGELLRMTPQGSRHATAVSLGEETLRRAFGLGFAVRVQMPLALDDDSEPEPDLAVVTGSPRDYRDAHPRTAVIIVEVADATLEYDRGRKARLYARTGIQDYWILNLIEQCLEVYRDPVPDGSGFGNHVNVSESGTVAPLVFPNTRLAVADFLP